MRRPILVAVALLAAAGLAQAGQSAQQLFEEGQYEPALRALNERRDSGVSDPTDRFLAAQIQLKLSRPDQAKQEVESLTADANTTWGSIGESVQALIDGDTQRALDRATQAAEASPNHFYAQYQLGLVKARREDWAGAAQAFDRASKIDVNFAYAFYYAGFAYSKVQRADLTAEHFERFLKLAPKAPERLAVESVLRVLRG